MDLFMDVFVPFLNWSFIVDNNCLLMFVSSHQPCVLNINRPEVCLKVILWFELIRSIALLKIPPGHAIFKTSSKVLFLFKFIRLKICCAVNILLQFLKHHFQTLKNRLVRRLLDSMCM